MLKKFLYGFLLAFVLLLGFAGVFMYKATNGINFYESDPIDIPSTLKETSILVFTKTNGFRHGDGIKGAIKLFDQLAEDNDWSIVHTNSGGAFTLEQLNRFDLVIWNNVTGKVLKKEQRQAFQTYINGGGGYLGIHGSGDFSHHWDWYEEQLIGAKFSHHSMNPQLQEGVLALACDTVKINCSGLPNTFKATDEWYVFLNNPRERSFNVLYNVDPNTVNTNGNIPILASDKDFGMSPTHPIVWYKEVGQGRSFYSSLGHNSAAFENPAYQQILEEGIRWTSGIY